MSVNVVSQAKSGLVPNIVVLKIYYHQVSKTTKKIIKATVSFSNYTNPTDNQNKGLDPFHYSLSFSLIPLTHTDLTIMFALDWQVYLVLYFGIGLVAISIVAIWTVYHTLMEKFLF